MTATAFWKLPNLCANDAWQDELVWQPFHAGVEIYPLYESQNGGSQAALLRCRSGASVPHYVHSGFEHILVPSS